MGQKSPLGWKILPEKEQNCILSTNLDTKFDKLVQHELRCPFG